MSSPIPQHAPELVEDFDAWWSAHQDETRRTGKPVRIRGVVVYPPTDIPLHVQLGIEQGGDLTEERLRSFVSELYGPETLDAWIAAGMGGHELGVILAWSSLRAQGRAVSFADAVATAKEASAAQAQELARRQAARDTLATAAAGHVSAMDTAAAQAVVDAGKALSSGGGAPWSPTSGGSTGFGLPSSPGWASSSSASSSPA